MSLFVLAVLLVVLVREEWGNLAVWLARLQGQGVLLPPTSE